MRRFLFLVVALAVLSVGCERSDTGGSRSGGSPTPVASPAVSPATALAGSSAIATPAASGPLPAVAQAGATKPAGAATAPAAAATKPAGSAPATPPTQPTPAGATAPPPAAKSAAPAAQPSARQPALPAIADVADQVRPAVAFIAVRSGSVQGGRVQPSAGVGSGAIFDPRGYIFTNNHVVEGGQQIKVALPDGRTFDARLVGRDPSTDIAVIKIDGQNLPVAKLGDSTKLKVGEWVVAIGNALGLEGGPTVTAGIVGALGRSIDEPGGVGAIEDAIQTDAAINPGNSGGPLVNMNGEVVGINTLVAGQVSQDIQAQGIGFAISINSAKPIIDELVAKGRVERPWLGVSVGTLTPAIAQQLGIRFVEGIVVSEVVPSSPAARAGLRAGDVITAVGPTAIKNTANLRDALAKQKAGDRVELTVVRGGNSQKVPIQLGARPETTAG